MRTFLSRAFALLALSCALVLIAACGGSQHGDVAETPAVPAPVLPVVPPPPPAPSPTRTFAYVANATAGTISVFEASESGELRYVGEVQAGSNVQYLAVHPSGRFAYGVSTVAGTVYGYSIDQTTGMLSPVGNESPTGTQPQQIRVHPTGRFAYVSNFGDGTLMRYTVADDGQLQDPLVTDVGASPTGFAFDTNGNFLYVESDDNVSAYSIGDNGELTLFNSVATVGLPADVAVTGRAAYVVGTMGEIYVHPIDATGAVGDGIPVSAGDFALAMAIDPDERFAYAANFGDGTLSMYTIDPGTGALRATVPSTVSTGLAPAGVAIHPNGRAAYVTSAGGNAVHVFTLDRTTGVLTPLGEPVPAGTGAFGIAFVSIPR